MNSPRFALVVVVLSGLSVARAADTYWQYDPTTPGDWSAPANWSRGVPTRTMDVDVDVGIVHINGGSPEVCRLYLAGTGTTILRQYAGDFQTLGGSSGHPGGIYLGNLGFARYEMYGGTLSLADPYGKLVVGRGEAGEFFQSTGTVTVPAELVLGSQGSPLPSHYGRYELAGGVLTVKDCLISEHRGRGEFLQTGGSATFTGDMLVGSYLGESTGLCDLRGGTLTARDVRVGRSGTGRFLQSGGTAAIEDLRVAATGTIRTTGGLLSIGQVAQVDTPWDFDGGAVTLNVGAGALFNCGRSALLGTGAVRMTAGAGSICIFPAGFDPRTDFAQYHSDGITHVSGTPLTIPAGTSLQISGDLYEHVVVYGTVANLPDELLNFHKGLQVRGSGEVVLSNIPNYSHVVTVDDTTSGVFDDGYLRASLHIGTETVGRFTQNGGTLRTGYVGVGCGPYYASGAGSYELISGTLDCFYRLDVGQTTSGNTGSGVFIQRGGSSSALGVRILRAGRMEIHGGEATYGELKVQYGDYVQSGGTVTAVGTPHPDFSDSGYVWLSGARSNITGGSLTCAQLDLDQGTFAHSAGTVNPTGQWGMNVGATHSGATTYVLSGTARVLTQRLGVRGRRGLLQQSGGVLSTGRFEIGDVQHGGQSTYELSGGTASVGEMIVGLGWDYDDRLDIGYVNQSGGEMQIGHLQVTGWSVYTLSGGSLTVADSVDCSGAFTFGGGAATMTAGGVVSLARAPLQAGAASFHLLPDSLLVVPPGFQPETDFAEFVNEGLVGETGGDIPIAAGRTVVGRGAIHAHVDLGGSLAATAGQSLNVRGGLSLSPGASAQLGDGVVEVREAASKMSGGDLHCAELWVGPDPAASFEQSGGDVIVTKACVARGEDARGTYILRDGTLTTDKTLLGSDGYGDVFAHGRFRQYGGSHTTRILYAGVINGNHGTYELVGGDLDTITSYVGYDGNGVFIQTGGVHRITRSGDTYSGYLWIGGGTSSYDSGRYELHGGQLITHSTKLYVYAESTEFLQTGGEHRIASYLGISGDYTMQGGQASAGTMALTYSGKMHQSGGDVTVDSLTVGEVADYYADYCLYEISSGSLTADNVSLKARYSSGRSHLVQAGGAVNVAGRLDVGSDGYGDAAYLISAGTLTADELWVTRGGRLATTDAAAAISISGSFRLRREAGFSAVPGATIHMTGSEFVNESTDPSALAGLKNLAMIFEGGSADVDPFEVAGADGGGSWEAFHDNFTLGTLALGGADVGQVQLVDNFDNLPGTEALYLRRLSVGPGSTLDLNGLNVYCLDFSNSGLITGGAVTQVAGIDSINATFLASGFDASAGVLTVSDAADIVLESAGGQVTYAAGGLVLTATLAADNSAGGLASALFRGGSVVVTDSVASPLLAGDLDHLALHEVVDGSGLLAGSGYFDVTGGVLEEAFGQAYGEVVQITFQIDPADIADFSADFTGVSNITLTPIPEPATLALLGLGGMATLRGRRRKRKPQRTATPRISEGRGLEDPDSTRGRGGVISGRAARCAPFAVARATAAEGL